jgi:hypothetical protein
VGHTVSCFQAELEVLLTAAAFTENDFQLLRECRPVALWHRVASWFNFRLKIGIWVHFGESCNVCMYVCMCILWTWSSILQPFDIFYACLLYFVVIRYIFPRFGILHQDKSGSPALPTNYRSRTRGHGISAIFGNTKLFPSILFGRRTSMFGNRSFFVSGVLKSKKIIFVLLDTSK